MSRSKTIAFVHYYQILLLFFIANDIIEGWGEITSEKPKTTKNKQLEPNQVQIKNKNKHLKDIWQPT